MNINEIPIFPMDDNARKLMKNHNKHGLTSDFVVRAPGRVNLIGEHIDYNGYAVLPMALEQAIYVAVAFTSADLLSLTNTDPSYESFVVPLKQAVCFGAGGPPSKIHWFHYVLCAFRGIADYANNKHIDWNPPCLALQVGGSEFGGLWPAAGLSSSSALVVASAVALVHASRLRISRHELAVLCARCERYIGMEGGGMDQAASLLGIENSAILIEFTKPLVTVHPVTLPPGIVFVIAHSGVHARKAATSMYNERVSECRLASRLLIAKSPHPDILTFLDHPPCLADAQRAWNVLHPAGMLTVRECGQSIVDSVLPTGKLTRDQIIDWMSLDDFNACLTPRAGQMQEFCLNDRAKHVFSEAERTLSFVELCQSLSGKGDNAVQAEYIGKLGSLMNASQTSCANLYNCSCPELDDLIRVCRAANSLGSRLTGAGWGGCTVSLVKTNHAQEFMQQVRKEYYFKRGMEADADRLIFISKPGLPASVMLPD